MKNNTPKIILYAIIILTSQAALHSYAKPAFTEASEILKEAAGVLTEGFKTLDDAAKKLDDAAKKIEKASPLFGSDAAKKIAEAGEKFAPITQACGVVYVVYKTWSAYDYFFPSDDARKAAEAQALKVQNELKYLKAKQSFEDCLLNNANTDKNYEGLPSACEKTAQAFAVVAGHSEITNIKAAFKEYFK
jgi:hypothetical protein